MTRRKRIFQNRRIYIKLAQTSNFKNSTMHVPTKEIHSEFAQTFSLSHSPTMRNEFTRSLNALHHLSVRCRSIPIDCRKYGRDRLPLSLHRRSRSTWLALSRLLHRRMIQEHFSITTAYRPWTQDSFYFAEIPRIAGI